MSTLPWETQFLVWTFLVTCAVAIIGNVVVLAAGFARGRHRHPGRIMPALVKIGRDIANDLVSGIDWILSGSLA